MLCGIGTVRVGCSEHSHTLQLRLICINYKKSSVQKGDFCTHVKNFFAMTRVKISTKVWGMDT